MNGSSIMIAMLVALVMINVPSTDGLAIGHGIKKTIVSADDVAISLEKLAEVLNRDETRKYFEDGLNLVHGKSSKVSKRQVSEIVGILSSLGTFKFIISGLPQLIITSKECLVEISGAKSDESWYDSVKSWFKEACNKFKEMAKSAWRKVKSWFTGNSQKNESKDETRPTFSDLMHDFLDVTKRGLENMARFGSCVANKNKDSNLLLNAIKLFAPSLHSDN